MLYSASDKYPQFSHGGRRNFIAALFLVSVIHLVLVISLWTYKDPLSDPPEALRMAVRTIVLPAEAPAPFLRAQQAPAEARLAESSERPPPAPVPQKRVAKQPHAQTVPQKTVITPTKSRAAASATPPPVSTGATPAAPVTDTKEKSAQSVEADIVVETPARHDVAYLQNPAPDYPVLSRRRREEGTVYLLVWVSRSGNPDKIQVARSSGFTRLDDAARKTVMQWRFVPARRGKSEIDAKVTVPVVFRLNK